MEQLSLSGRVIAHDLTNDHRRPFLHRLVFKLPNTPGVSQFTGSLVISKPEANIHSEFCLLVFGLVISTNYSNLQNILDSLDSLLR